MAGTAWRALYHHTVVGNGNSCRRKVWLLATVTNPYNSNVIGAAIIASVRLSSRVHDSGLEAFAGVWGSPRGQILTLMMSHPSQLRLGEFDCEVARFKEVPNGDFVAGWDKCRSVVLVSQPDYIYASRKGEGAIGDPYRSDRILDAGEARLTMGRALTDGSYNSFHFTLLGQTGSVKLSENFWKLCDFSDLDFSGVYSAPHYKLHLQPSDDGTAYSGSLAYNDKKWIVNGARSGTRVGFDLISSDYGSTIGSGYVSWTPSLEQVDKIKSHDAKLSDILCMTIKLPGILPNGQRLNLRLQ